MASLSTSPGAENRRGVWNRKVQKTVPIFPGAMFVPDFEADYRPAQALRHGKSAVSLNTTARAAHLACIMDQIRKFEIKLNRDPERRKFKANQRIRITDGPFELWKDALRRLTHNYDWCLSTC